MSTARNIVITASVLAVMSATSAVAADGTWTADASGNWSDTGNWAGGTVADGIDSTATFGDVITATRNINLDSSRTIGNITAADTSNDFIITNNTLTLTLTTGIPTINVPQNGRELTLGSVTAGTNGIRKTGAGRLNLVGPNTFTGGLVLEAGDVGENGANGLSTAALNNNDITLNGDATIIFAGGSSTTGGITLNNGSVLTTGNNNSSITINGPVTGSGGLKVIKVGDGANTIYLNSSANTFTGGVDFAAARRVRLLLNSFVDSAAPGAGNIRFSVARSGFDHEFILNSGFSTALTLNNRQFDLGSPSETEHAVIRNNSAQNFTINTDLIISGTGAKPFTLGGTGSGTNTFAGSITNSSGVVELTKADSCTWILSGENTYTGATTVTAGTLVLQGSACLEDTATINITGGSVQIDDREVVGELQFGGVSTNSGRWGATGSGAENINDTYFTGTEILYVGIDFPPSGTVLTIK